MLSRRENDTYQFIRGYIQQHGQGPLLTEIATGLNIRSKGVAHRYVQQLAQAGLIRLTSGRHRGIGLADSEYLPIEGNPCTSLPLLGRIAAGLPIEAIPDESQLDLAEFFTGPNRFVLKVSGDSMIEAGILDGDMVIIEKRQRADNDDIVVALIDLEEATLKRIRHNPDGSVTLYPANRLLSPMVYSAERVTIQGILVGQMRSYQ
ncbi:MAG: transcriptional repressor LexA [Gammaproteobacteria bacterium]|nr:MAG: transcriptional repressor LexA [Gammaproteobacteria bacterium]